MEKNINKKLLLKLTLLSLIAIALTYSFYSFYANDIKKNKDNKELQNVTIDEIQNLKNKNNEHGNDGSQDVTTYSIDINNNNSKTDLNKINTMYFTDLNEAINMEFVNSGKKRKMVLTLYYDYEQINFKIDQSGKYLDKYIFDINDKDKINLKIYLDDKIKMDDNLHKLMVSFTTGYDVNAYSLENMSNFYGIHTLYDIVYGKDKNYKYNDIVNKSIASKNNSQDIKSNIEKKSYFNFISSSLVLNMDYNNVFQQDTMLKYPEKIMNVKPEEQFELMYNISNENNSNGLLLLTLGFNQTNIDNSTFKIVELKKNAITNGKIKIKAPSIKGKYEVIGYIIYDPFEKITEQNRDKHPIEISTSTRYTLNVD